MTTGIHFIQYEPLIPVSLLYETNACGYERIFLIYFIFSINHSILFLSYAAFPFDIEKLFLDFRLIRVCATQ